jgi:hypothetical protein
MDEADDDAVVRAAAKLAWPERLTHSHWRVRAEAYAAVTAAAATAADANASPLADFGAIIQRAAPGSSR